MYYQPKVRLSDGRVAGAEVVDSFTGESVGVRARAVANATGPWVDEIRRLEDPGAAPCGRLSKGIHVVLPLERPWSAGLTIPHDRVRVSFALPWEGMLLLGTTDTPYDGDPGDVCATEEDVQAVLAEAAQAVDDRLLERERVRASFAGLRVLPGLHGETARARRETLLLRGPGGMLSVAGGKLTTYRRIALAALDALRADLGLSRLDEAPLPLPGAADPALVALRLRDELPELDDERADHLAHLYGAAASAVAARGAERIHPDAPDVIGQIAYAREREWACTDDDVLARRTTLGLRGLGASAPVRGAEVAERR
jgi:glycerol-3-phosphate dehydrogenase